MAGQQITAPVTIAAVSPGLFTADRNGQGVAAAVVIRVGASGDETPSLAYTCPGSGACSPSDIDVSSATDTVFLSLFGTGIRGTSGLAGVKATIGGVPVDVQFAGAQGQYPGLDQINLKLTSALARKGDAAVVVTIDGKPANTVGVRMR